MTILQTLLVNRMSADYADVAVLPHSIGEQMLMRLDLVSIKPKVIAELGSSDGFCTSLLTVRYPEAKIFSIPDPEAAEKLSLADESVDLIVANLILPWSNDFEATLREWRRILRPNGLLMFTSLGPDTLNELHHAPVEFPHLIDMHHLGDGLTRIRFADPVLDVEYVTVTYRNHAQLAKELQTLGMVSGDAAQMTLTPTADGIYSLTFEVVYGHAWRPEAKEDYAADEEGVVRIPLSHLRSRRS
jgi:malonyl-CoA O-methyltransferase